jgi:hypothetical protein
MTPPPVSRTDLAMSGRDEVDTGDVQADDQRRASCDLGIVRVDLVGPVDRRAAGGEVGGGAQHHPLAGRGHALGREAGALQIFGDERVDLDAGHHLLVAIAAPRILVHQLHQLRDGAAAVADDGSGDAFGNRDQFAIDDEDAVVVAGEILLHDDGRSLGLLLRLGEAEAQALLVRDGGGDAAAVIAVQRLGHDGVAQPPRRPQRVLLIAHDQAARDRDAVVAQQVLGEVLVACDLGGDQSRSGR